MTTLLVLIGVCWTMAVVTGAYCWVDMVARTRSPSYKKLAEGDDAGGVRWRYVTLALWIVAGTTLTALILPW